MLDEIKYKTRKFSEDYIWFSTNNVNESWKEGYKALFFKADSSVNLFAEIENDSYRIFFDKIDSKRQDVQHRNLYCVLLSEGKRGSDSAKAMFRLLSNYFIGKKRSEIQQLFDEHFTAEFIDTIYERNTEPEVEEQIHEHLNAIVEKLQNVEFQRVIASKNNSYIFTTYDSNANAFFTDLEFITNNKPISGIVSLVMTGNSLETKFLKEFDYSKFSRGLCLSMTTVENGRIVKKIKTVVSIEISALPTKQVYTQGEKLVIDGCVIEIKYSNGTTENKTVTDDEIKGFNTQNIGKQKVTIICEDCTTSFEVTVKPPFPIGEPTPSPTVIIKEPPEEDFVSKISSNQILKRFLILLAVIILTLILAVRSCWKKSGENSPSKSSSTKEQKLSQDSLKNSTKSNDTLKVKFDK